MAKALRSSKIHGSPVYPIDFTRRTQVVRGGRVFIRYGVPDAAWEERRLQTECEMTRGAEVGRRNRKLPGNYLSHGGKVSLSQREPPSQTEHYDLGLQGKL